MPAPRFTLVRYQHEGGPLITQGRQRFILASLVIGVLAAVLAFPFGALLLTVPLVARASAQRYLQIGPRYLLLDQQILYYANVRHVELSHLRGRLRLVGFDGEVLDIESARFPTNARKPEKIAKNKAGKFDKVSGRIVERVRLFVPDVVVEETMP